MNLQIPVTRKDLMENYLYFLNPLLKLREESELKVLAAHLTLDYNYRFIGKYKEDNFNSILFSKETQDSLRTKLGFSEKSYNKSMKKLHEKHMILDNKLNPSLLKYPKDGKFKITINFVESKDGGVK